MNERFIKPLPPQNVRGETRQMPDGSKVYVITFDRATRFAADDERYEITVVAEPKE